MRTLTRPFPGLTAKTNDYIFSAILAVVFTGGSYLVGLGFGWITAIDPLEAFAVFTSYACTYLCVRERRFNYVLAVITTAAYCLLFWQAELLASMFLQIYLIPTVIYGWFRWKSDADARPVRHVEVKMIPAYLGVTLAGYFGAVWLVTSLGGSLPFFDAAILDGTILAQLLLDNKRLETWVIWLLVDIIAIYVYFSSGLFLVGVQYLAFLLNTVWGYLAWRKSMKSRQRREAFPEGDMRSTPVNNPLDVREDGSIREGDPAWDFIMSIMNGEEGGMATQRADGTWETKTW